jgi:hypothetical protein
MQITPPAVPIRFSPRQRRAAKASAIPFACVILLSLSASSAFAQQCQTSSDLDDATNSAITSAGRHYFDLAAKGDVAALRQGADATLISDFSPIEMLVKDHQQDLAAAQVTIRGDFLLEVDGSAPLAHAEFYCGVFGKNGQTPGSAIFNLDNLPPGKYAVVLLEAAGAKASSNFSLILSQAGADWKLAGAYLKPSQSAGHDTDWFTARAREFKAKGQAHNAWWFYLEARSVASPLSFMFTQATDKLYDEFQSLQPADLPANGKTVELAAAGSSYQVTAIFPQGVGDDLDLIVKYQVTDASDSNHCYQSNVAVIAALAAKYPEIRAAFAAVVARAQDSSGRDYGTLQTMKEIK